MTYDLGKLRSHGDPWCVHLDLNQASGTHTLVTPKQIRDDLVNVSAGQKFEERWQVIVLGFAWAFDSGAADTGFTLQSVSDEGTLALFEVLAQADGFYQGQVSPCYIPLPTGRSESPGVEPASLAATNVQTITGSLLVWGTHEIAQGSRDLSGQYGATGSIDYTYT